MRQIQRERRRSTGRPCAAPCPASKSCSGPGRTRRLGTRRGTRYATARSTGCFALRANAGRRHNSRDTNRVYGRLLLRFGFEYALRVCAAATAALAVHLPWSSALLRPAGVSLPPRVMRTVGHPLLLPCQPRLHMSHLMTYHLSYECTSAHPASVSRASSSAPAPQAQRYRRQSAPGQ